MSSGMGKHLTTTICMNGSFALNRRFSKGNVTWERNRADGTHRRPRHPPSQNLFRMLFPETGRWRRRNGKAASFAEQRVLRTRRALGTAREAMRRSAAPRVRRPTYGHLPQNLSGLEPDVRSFTSPPNMPPAIGFAFSAILARRASSDAKTRAGQHATFPPIGRIQAIAGVALIEPPGECSVFASPTCCCKYVATRPPISGRPSSQDGLWMPYC